VNPPRRSARRMRNGARAMVVLETTEIKSLEDKEVLQSNPSRHCCESRSVWQGYFVSKETLFGFNHPQRPPVALGCPRLASIWCQRTASGLLKRKKTKRNFRKVEDQRDALSRKPMHPSLRIRDLNWRRNEPTF
jgi:hypothetical protein